MMQIFTWISEDGVKWLLLGMLLVVSSVGVLCSEKVKFFVGVVACVIAIIEGMILATVFAKSSYDFYEYWIADKSNLFNLFMWAIQFFLISHFCPVDHYPLDKDEMRELLQELEDEEENNKAEDEKKGVWK